MKSTRSPLNPILGDLAVKNLVPHGFKGAVRSAGKRAYSDHKKDIDARWREECIRLNERCVSSVSRMSTSTKNLTMAGNSRKLVTKFNKVMKMKTAHAYIGNLVLTLEEIQGLDLIWNCDIGEELKRREEEREWLRQEESALRAGAKAIVEEAKRARFSNKDSVLEGLKGLPRPRQTLVSAFNQLQSPDPLGPRLCILSCRMAIEQLCIDAGGSKNWKEGLANICTSSTNRQQVNRIYQYLSGRGSHGGYDPTVEDAEHCLEYTLTTFGLLLQEIY